MLIKHLKPVTFDARLGRWRKKRNNWATEQVNNFNENKFTLFYETIFFPLLASLVMIRAITAPRNMAHRKAITITPVF